MISTNGNGLVYREDVTTLSIYEFFLDHRVVMEIVVDGSDADLTMWVGAPGATKAFAQLGGELNAEGQAFLRKTTGRAYKSEYVGDAGETTTRINDSTVHSYFTPRRVARALADIYVPKQA